MEKKKILVVDDEHDFVELLRFRLEKNDYTVFVAFDGEQAIDVAEGLKPDLIILDILLPKKNGYEVCKELRKNPDFEKIPVIMLTGKDSEADIILAKKVGANSYISKPFEPQLLLYSIKNLLEGAPRTQRPKK